MYEFNYKTALILASSIAIAACSNSDDDDQQTDLNIPPADGGNPETGTNPGDATSSIINQENYKAILTLLLPAVDGTRLKEAANTLTAAVTDIGSNDSTLGITPVDSSFDEETSRSTTNYTCDAGGLLTYESVVFFSSFEFDECVLEGSTYTGFMSTNYQRDQSDIVFEELDIASSSSSVFLNGALQSNHSTSAFYNQSENIAFSRAELSGDGDLLITDYESSMASTSNSGQSEIERTFTSTHSVNASWLEGEVQSLQVETTQSFQGQQPDDFYTNGIMIMTASDGSTLTVNADNGDPVSVQVTIDAAGVTSADMLNWSDTLQLRCLDDTQDSGGFQYACGS